MPHLETENRLAFEATLEGLRGIDRFRRTRDPDLLKPAHRALDKAHQLDPDYLLPPYYLAVVQDLLGDSDGARDKLKELDQDLANARENNGSKEVIRAEITNNLALGLYHDYTPSDMRGAASDLNALLDRDGRVDRLQRRRALALLAQTRATAMIPRDADEVERNPEERAHIQRCHADALKLARGILRTRPLIWLFYREYNQIDRQSAALARNAIGIAEMNYTDFSRETDARKLRRLKRALRFLEKDGNLFDGDWATLCDLGSCHMRIGVWSKRDEEFSQAYDLLMRVINTLRPDYGFALFECGRVCRLRKNFEEAGKLIDQAKKIPEAKRDVSDQRIERELEFLKTNSTDYP